MFVLLALLAVGLAALSAPAIAQCPSSTVTLPTGASSTTLEQTFDFTDGPDWGQGDHAVGVFSLHNAGSLAPTVVTARDRFDVTGVPAGTPVSVLAVFEIAGWAYTTGCGGSGCCGTLAAAIRAGPDSAKDEFVGNTFSGSADFSGAVVVPLTLVAGTPRDIEFQMSGRRCPGGAHDVEATGTIRFIGDDPNAMVTSCKGFGPIAVPVRRSSWGRLKTLYR
jgi:ferredoxin